MGSDIYLLLALKQVLYETYTSRQNVRTCVHFTETYASCNINALFTYILDFHDEIIYFLGYQYLCL